jgi:shikimate dehydrogenase
MLGMRAAVCGHPISHSLSPVLHRAAYAALGLEYSYDAIDVTEESFEEFVATCDDSWLGLSLTMPLKEVAFSVATTVSIRAKLTGAINTLIFDDGIRADNTDIFGIEQAVRESTDSIEGPFTIVGSGATARSAVVAARNLGATSVTIVARNQETANNCLILARELGITSTHTQLESAVWLENTVTINTTPAGVADELIAPGTATTGLLLDVIYSPWPTQLAQAWRSGGGTTCPGHVMLLHQAREQVRLMTGQDAPIDAMREALEQTLASR